jgi:hypothetical protein
MNDKVVRITLNDARFPVPDLDPVPVKMNAQKVRFAADFDFSIRINDYTDVSAARKGPDGAYEVKTGIFSDEKQYKYDIIANGNVTDPILDVKP